MSIDRRELLKAGLAVSAAAALPNAARAEADFAPQPGAWRSFQVLTRLEIKADGKTQAWIPVPAVNEPDWFKSLGSTWTSNGRAALVREPKYGAEMLHVEWTDGEKNPVVEVTSRIATRDRAIDLEKPGRAACRFRQRNATATRKAPNSFPLTASSSKPPTRSSPMRMPRPISRRHAPFTSGSSTTHSATPRCAAAASATSRPCSGRGNLGGKCADLNALYVGLARAAGLPARDVYGIRVAPSKFGYKSLGTGSAVITKAQHCRSEVYLAGFGWVPVDAADVRKVVLEEPPTNLAIDDPKVVAARKALFGSWETNWLAYNFAHDVALPGSRGPKLGFLMYPQAETASMRLDCLDPDNFKYTITAKELTST